MSAGCPADEADGSSDNPYPSISEAVARASVGATVLIAPGTYAEQIQITKNVSLVGSSDPTKPETAAAVLTTPAQYAVVVSSGEEVVLQGLYIKNPRVGGIKVVDAAVTVQGSMIEGAVAAADGRGGYGVVADHGSLKLENSIITGSTGVGVFVSNARGIILQNQIAENDGGGLRLQDAVDQVTVQGNTLSRNHLFGIGVFNSNAIILQNEVSETGWQDDVAGDGILVSGGEAEGSAGVAEVVAQENIVSKSSRTGVLCSGALRSIIVQNNTVEASGFGTAGGGGGGGGIWLQNGRPNATAANMIENNKIIGNRFSGITLTGETNGIILRKNTIADTVLGTGLNDVAEEKIGDGITISRSASARIKGNTISGNGRFGVILDAPAGVGMSLENNTISHLDKVGIILQNVAGFLPGANMFDGTGETIQAVEPGTHVVMDDNLAMSGR